MYNEKEIIIKKSGYDDLFFLSKYILNYKDLTNGYHKKLCQFTQHNRYDLDLEPRGHFKTSIRTIAYSIFLIINNPNVRILINHKILGKAREILREIKGHFERNEKFKYFYGDMKGETWGTDAIIVKREKILKEPTIAIGSPDHEVTSGHFDYILNDDLVGLRDMISTAEREKVLNYYKTLKYILEQPNGIMKTTGTRWHLEDLYNHIITNLDIKTRVRKAEENGAPIFPERFTLKLLKEMSDEDPIIYEAQMNNNPTAMKNQLYSLDKLKFYDHAAFKGGYNIAYVDPAFGKMESKEPCFLSFPILSVVNDNLHVIDWITNRQTPEQNEAVIISKILEHNIQRLGIEGNVAQSEFSRNIKKTLQSQNIILNIENINNNQNKDRRIQSMHGTVINNVLFREDWEKAYPEGMRQFTLYPYHKFKDAPDALAGVVNMITGHTPVRVRYI